MADGRLPACSATAPMVIARPWFDINLTLTRTLRLMTKSIDIACTLTSADLAGKTVIVNFWNTWCIPCQEELPALKQFYADHKSDGDVVMLGIVRRDDAKTVKQFVSGEGIGWTIALDPTKAAALDFGTRGQPETFAISPSGQIVAFKPGPMSRTELEQFLNAGRISG